MRSKLELAAVLLKSLPPATAHRLVRQLPPRELHRVEAEMERIGPVKLEDLQAALSQLEQDESATAGAQEVTRSEQNSVEARPERRSGATPRPAIRGNPFQFLLEGDASLASQLLRNEHPALAAKVLSQVPPMFASEWMRTMDPAQRVSVMKRLCDQEPLTASEADQLAATLRQRWQRLRDPAPGTQHSPRETATSELAPETESNQSGSLDPAHASLAFDDLQHFPDHTLQQLLRSVDTSLWAPALAGARPETRARIHANLAPAPARILQRELAELDGLSPDETAKAQDAILEAARRFWPQ